MLNKVQLEKLKISLFAGKYNLLLGAGISLDSSDSNGEALPSAWGLQSELCKLKGVSTDRPLTKVYPLLDSDEKQKYLTNRFSNVSPGDTVKEIPGFIWRQIFTFNIDDALENAYEISPSRKQDCAAINFNQPYVTNLSQQEVATIHLHGYAKDPAAGYVFALTEYAKNSQSINPWMNALAQLLATEPFIIAGTSLTEPDLEYYLSHRTDTTPRLDRGPSILVEPKPDAVTISDCKRHGLILVEDTLANFLRWLKSELGAPPTLETLILPSLENIFLTEIAPVKKISFFSSFELVQPVAGGVKGGTHSGFYFGQQPSWQDLAAELDVATEDLSKINKKIDFFLSGGAAPYRALVVISEPGAGKSTEIRRVAYDLAVRGKKVFYLKPLADVDYDDMLDCLRAVDGPCVLFVDGVAENVGLVRLLLEKDELDGRVFIVCAERDYRKAHLEANFSAFEIEYFHLKEWSKINYVQLIERFRQNGLLASPDALRKPSEASNQISGDPVAIATCRLLNNFKPFDQILRSVWDHADSASKRSYLTAALAEYCVPVGLKYSILLASQDNPKLNDQLITAHPLPLGSNDKNSDYIFPLNATLGDRMLLLSSKDASLMLLNVFVNLANAVAPFVNRKTIIQRTAEARLSGRLFQSDEVVTRFLGSQAESFYAQVKKNWEWNSRYWEQRALELSSRNLITAVQYARHAVAIEAHPFPWTTLASLLMKQMVDFPRSRNDNYNEAFELLLKALDFEATKLRRHSGHAYFSLFKGTRNFIELGGALTPVSRAELLSRISDASLLLGRNAQVMNAISQLQAVL